MNKQEVFEKVVNHLFTQNKQSYDPILDCCALRSPDGLKCSLGILIPDDIYDERMEGLEVDKLIRDFPVFRKLWEVESQEDLSFLHRLQYLHDDQDEYNDPITMESIEDIAETFQLNTDFLTVCC